MNFFFGGGDAGVGGGGERLNLQRSLVELYWTTEEDSSGRRRAWVED